MIHIDRLSELNDIKALLVECGLPAADISADNPPQFFGIRSQSGLLAVVGLEIFGTVGLLRSLAVKPDQRGRGRARQLIAYAEHVAAAQGVDALFLLTTTAADLFEKLGFVPIPRASAPAAIQATSQFADLCPASSALLMKPIAGKSYH